MDLEGKRVVTPSKPRLWEGTVDRRTAPLTREQVRERDARAVEIKRKQQRYDLPALYEHTLTLEPTIGHPLPRFVKITCPVVSCTRTRDTICVIAPNGYETWVPWRRKP